MKKHPLYKNHEDVFKSKQPILYYLTKFYDNEGFYLFLSIISTVCIMSIAAICFIGFFYKGSWTALFSGLALFSMLAIFIKKTSKRYTEFSKYLTLEKRKAIAKDVLIEAEKMIESSDITIDQVSKQCIDKFRKKVKEDTINLLSDDEALIKKSANYFFGDSETGSFLGSFNNLKYDVWLANVEFKNQLSRQKSVPVGEKRFEEVASSL